MKASGFKLGNSSNKTSTTEQGLKFVFTDNVNYDLDEIIEKNTRTNSSCPLILKSTDPVDVEVKKSYDPYCLDHNSTCIQLAAKACEELGLEVNITATGGGSDASHINGHGVPCTVLGTGMTNVHTVEEILLEEDLYMCAELTLKIVSMAAK